MIHYIISLLCMFSFYFLNSIDRSEVETDNIHTKIVAHRGAWKNTNLPQNSVASLKKAIKIGASASEFDLHLTRDEVIVCSHDHDFQGIDIEKSNYSELLPFKLSNGEDIPTFDEMLKIGSKHKEILLFAELKPSRISKERSMHLAEKVVEKVKEANLRENVVFISFDYDVLKKIIEIDDQAKTMYLNGNYSPQRLKSDKIWGADYQYKKYQKKPEWIIQAKDLGIKLNAWTVNDSIDMDFITNNDFDFVTTDEPEILLNRISPQNSYDNWELVWNDEFDYEGFPDSTKWSFATGGHGWGNNEKQYYVDKKIANVNVKEGCLNIIAQRQQFENCQYTSTKLTTKDRAHWKYGKIEVRAKTTKGRGLWPAIWMLPVENKYGGWPKSGEIDIMEYVGYNPDSVFQTVHTESFNHIKGTQKSNAIKLDDADSQFHTYGIIWDAEKIEFYVDHIKQYAFENRDETYKEWPFDQSFYLILNLAVGGNWGGKFGIDDNIFPSVFEIDYVRVFEKR